MRLKWTGPGTLFLGRTIIRSGEEFDASLTADEVKALLSQGRTEIVDDDDDLKDLYEVDSDERDWHAEAVKETESLLEQSSLPGGDPGQSGREVSEEVSEEPRRKPRKKKR